MAVLTFEDDLYHNKRLLRFAGEDFVSAMRQIAASVDGLAAELREINRREGLTPEAREALTSLINNLAGEDDAA